MKVLFCTPFLKKPTPQYLASLEASVPFIEADGWEHAVSFEVGNPYISFARAELARRAMKIDADVLVYLDYDLSWSSQDLATLLRTPGDVVGGTYRYKQEPEEYMGVIQTDSTHRPICRKDGCIAAAWIPAGFLKITRDALKTFAEKFDKLNFSKDDRRLTDLFNHGAYQGVWWGEDAAFCRNWHSIGGEVWLVPDLNITHWDGEKPYHGNYHQFLLRQPGGSKAA